MYARLRKSLALLLIVVLLALDTIRMPFTPSVSADTTGGTPIVALVVDRAAYQGDLQARIYRYANDIQSYLDNTRVDIYQVDSTTNPLLIASLTERLYSDGDGNGFSWLAGAIFIGDIPLPVVHVGDKAFPSVYPYVNFTNKAFGYDETKGYYASTNVAHPSAQIWHSFISPDTGNAQKDHDRLVAFFDKTHDYYTQAGAFTTAKTRKDPAVFILDARHDAQSADLGSWKVYENYLQHMEDFAYHRYTRDLASELYASYQKDTSESMTASGSDDALSQLLSAYAMPPTPDLSHVPDVQTKAISDKAVKPFHEVFNVNHINRAYTEAQGAGRYGAGTGTRVDTVPVVVSRLDEYAKRSILSANNSLEDAIGDAVKNQLSAPVRVLQSVTDDYRTYDNGYLVDHKVLPYINHYYGLSADTLTGALQCTIARGSSRLVEANRAYNIHHAGSDTQTLQNSLGAGQCFAGMVPQTQSFWGGNSPLNIDMSATALTNGFDMTLKSQRYDTFSQPIFDLAGMRVVSTGSTIEPASALDCEVNNLMLAPYADTSTQGNSTSVTYWPPEKGSTLQYSCLTRHQTLPIAVYTGSLDASVVPQIYFSGAIVTSTVSNIRNRIDAPYCLAGHIEVDGKNIRTVGSCTPPEARASTSDTTGPDGTATSSESHVITTIVDRTVKFKNIPSAIEHVSPTDEEYGTALKNLVTPSLPVDRDRYMDFLSQSGAHAMITYPDFFRMKLSVGETTDPAVIRQHIKSYLDSETATIRSMGGSGSTLDLYGLLSAAPQTLDLLVHSIAWLNIHSATAKYQYVAEHYLDTDGGELFPLMGHRSDYEIADIGGDGDGKSLSLSVDPESQAPIDPRVADILATNTRYQGLISGSNIARTGYAGYTIGSSTGTTTTDTLANPYYYGLHSADDLAPTRSTQVKASFSTKDITSVASSPIPATWAKASASVVDNACGSAGGTLAGGWIPSVLCWQKESAPATTQPCDCGGNNPASNGKAVALEMGRSFQFFAQGGMISKNLVASTSDTLTARPESLTGHFTDPKYQQDSDHNGIVDGDELIGGGDLLLDSPYPTYPQGTSIPLHAYLMRDGYLIDIDSTSQVHFDIGQIVAYSGGTDLAHGQVVYDASSSDIRLKNPNTLDDYVYFSPARVRASNGRAEYSLTARNHDMDIVAVASVKTLDKDGNPIVDKTSNRLTIVIRGGHISVSSSVPTASGSQVSSVYTAGTKGGVQFTIHKVDTFDQPISGGGPYTLRVFDDVSGDQLVGPLSVPSNTYTFDNSILKKAGVYRFEWNDSAGMNETNDITVVPAPPVNIQVTYSSTTAVSGQRTTILVRLLDPLGNLSTDRVRSIHGTISGGGSFVADDGTLSQDANVTTVEGYATFTMQSSGSDAYMKFTLADPKLESPITTIHAIDSARIHVEVDGSGSIVAGGDAHTVTISVLDKNNQPVKGLNGVATIDFPSLSGTPTSRSIGIQDGIMTGSLALRPWYVAGHDLTLSVQMPGITAIDGNILTVLPDEAMSVGLTADDPDMDIRGIHTTTLHATLYDRYGNIVTNHSPDYRVHFELPASSHGLLRFASGATIAAFSGGLASTSVSTMGIAGTSYIISTVTPDISSHGFTVVSQTGQTLPVHGISSNTLTLHTYATIDATTLSSVRYNTLYTVLQGADYGNITKPGYLGGEVIFGTGSSRSLAVTTLLNDTKQHTEVASFTPAGRYTAQNIPGVGLSPQIASQDGRSYIGLYDTYSKEYIARVWLGLDGSSDTLLPCTSGADPSTLDSCTVPRDPTQAYILMRGLTDTTIAKDPQSMTLSNAGGTLFTIRRSGEMLAGAGVSLQLDPDQKANILGIRIMLARTLVGYVAMRFTPETVGIHTSADIAAALAHAHNALVVEQISSHYTLRPAYVGNSTHAPTGVVMYAPDSGSDMDIDQDMIGGSDQVGFEMYRSTEGIGWTGKNHTLLDFAGGSTVGEATKSYQTYSTITLGDPIAHLPRSANAHADYDQTVGQEILHVPSGDPIDSYGAIDLRAHHSQDVAVFYQSGKIGILLNENGTYRDRGTLLDVADIGESRKAIGDFGKKWYDDIVAVSKQTNDLILLDNRDGVFIRKKPRIVDGSGATASLSGAVTSLRAYDMDSDGHTDLVTMDEGGEVVILYGRSDTKGDTYFEKKVIDTKQGVTLTGANVAGAVGSAGAVSWPGVPQLPDPDDQSQYLARSAQLAGPVKALVAAKTATGSSRSSTGSAYTGTIRDTMPMDNDHSMIDEQFFYQYAYRALSAPRVPDASAIIVSVGTDDTGAPNTKLTQQIADTEATIASANAPGHAHLEVVPRTQKELKTFVYSGYSTAYGVAVDKRYKDLDHPTVYGGDRVHTTIILKNITKKDISDLFYLDANPSEMFQQSGTGYTLIYRGQRTIETRQDTDSGERFDTIYGPYALHPGETVSIEYDLTAHTVTYGSLQAGLLEPGSQSGQIAITPELRVGASTQVYQPSGTGTQNKTHAYTSKTISMTNTYPKVVAKLGASEPLLSDTTSAPVNTNGVTIPSDINTPASATNLASQQSYAQGALDILTKDTGATGVPDSARDQGTDLFSYAKGAISTSGLNLPNLSTIGQSVTSTVSGFASSLGLGSMLGGSMSCADLPLNQAPLSPGSAPPSFGMPKWLLAESTGKPILSAFTIQTIPIPTGDPGMCAQIPIPSVWPTSPVGPTKDTLQTGEYGFPLYNTVGSSRPSEVPCGRPETGWPSEVQAGGSMGTKGVMDFFRMFYTPTTTGGQGIAMCYDSIPQVTGNIPPPTVSPFVPGGNCVFQAAQLNSCHADGSDGNLSDIAGPVTNGFINGTSMQSIGQQMVNIPLNQIKSIQTSIGGYLSGDMGQTDILKNMVGTYGRLPTLPSLDDISSAIPSTTDIGNGISNGTDRAGSAIGDIARGLGATAGNVGSNIGNSASNIADRIGNISLPSTSDIGNGISNGASYASDAIGNAANNLADHAGTMADNIGNGIANGATNLGNSISNTFTAVKGSFSSLTDSIANVDGKSLDIGSLSGLDLTGFQKIFEQRVSGFPDYIMGWTSGGNGIQQEITTKLASLPTMTTIVPDPKTTLDTGWSTFPQKMDQDGLWKDGSTGDPIAAGGQNISGVSKAFDFGANVPAVHMKTVKVAVDVPWIAPEDADRWIADAESMQSASGTTASGSAALSQNIERMQEAKQFPQKLEKTLEFKEQYADSLLCNIDGVETKQADWVKTNSPNLTSWIEEDTTVKNVLGTWQQVPDIFFNYGKQYEVDRNERQDLRQYMVDLITPVLPQTPNIGLTKQPNVVNDWHNVRTNMDVEMPELDFRPVPVVPAHPAVLASGEAGTSDTLAKIPDPPTMPTPPNMRTSTVPNLPSPPMIPSLGGYIGQFTQVLGRLTKVLGIYQTQPFAPEWRVGERIAEVTERQGTMPSDYIKKDTNKQNQAFTDTIGTKTYTDTSSDTSFIQGMAENSFKPLDTMTNNVSAPAPDPSTLQSRADDASSSQIASASDIEQGREAIRAVGQILAQYARDAETARAAEKPVSLETFRTQINDQAVRLIRSGVPQLVALGEKLAQSVRPMDTREIDQHIAQIQVQNDRKFALAREYVTIEKAKTARLKNELQEIVAGKKTIKDFSPLAKYRSDTMNISVSDMMTAEDTRQAEIHRELDRIDTDSRATTTLVSDKKSISDKLLASAASDMKTATVPATSTPASDPTPTTTASYHYDGIYYRTADGHQTRLFAYLAEMDGHEQAMPIDPVGDGRRDVLVRIGSSLYLKSTTSDPVHHTPVSTPVHVGDIRDIIAVDTDGLPKGSPNAFKETMSGPSSSTITFAPASVDRDSMFRMELARQVDTFDRIDQGNAATGSMRIVDLAPDLSDRTILDTSTTGATIRSTPVYIQSGYGQVSVRLPSVRTLGVGDRMTVGAHKILYTDGAGARISYVPTDSIDSSGSSTVPATILHLPAHANVEIDQTVRVTVLNGHILLYDTLMQRNTITIDSLRGLPILPDSELAITPGSRLTIGYWHGGSLDLQHGETYSYRSLGSRQDTYRTTLTLPNGFYYARIAPFDRNGAGDHAGLAILTPQLAADETGPDMQRVPDTIRVPILSEQTVDLHPYITDALPIKDIYIDGDPTVDTDGDMIPDDDRDSDDIHSSYHIRRGASMYEYVFGAYQTTYTRTIRIRATDINNHSSYKDVSLTVYAPVPQVQSATATGITGSVGDTIGSIPVDIFRIRGSVVEPVEHADGSTGSVLTDSGGVFTLSGMAMDGGILRSGTASIARIAERTGQITLTASGYSVQVSPAQSPDHTALRVLDRTGTGHYREEIRLPIGTPIESVSSLDSATGTGIYIHAVDPDISLAPSPTDAPSLPRGAYITDASRRPLAGISDTGDIYLLDTHYTLQYATYGPYIVIELRMADGHLAAEILYRIDVDIVTSR